MCTGRFGPSLVRRIHHIIPVVAHYLAAVVDLVMRISLSQLMLHIAMVHLLALTRRIEHLLLPSGRVGLHLLLLHGHSAVHVALSTGFSAVNLRLVSRVHATRGRITRQVASAAADVSGARSVMSTLLLILVLLTSQAALVDILLVHLLATVVLLSASAVEEVVVGHELMLAH